jgi:two-component system, NtrC family, response regulator AtoC
MSRILIIDDDDSIRESLDMYLTEEGHDVEIADKGYVGIGKFIDVQPEIVILDVRLPDMDGFAVYDELMKYDEQAKVIMITAFHDEDVIQKALMKGVFKFVKKPIDLHVLDRSLAQALEQSSAR